jgi:hypothetical protein
MHPSLLLSINDIIKTNSREEKGACGYTRNKSGIREKNPGNRIAINKKRTTK